MLVEIDTQNDLHLNEAKSNNTGSYSCIIDNVPMKKFDIVVYRGSILNTEGKLHFFYMFKTNKF